MTAAGVSAVVLAAGESKRFGGSKALALWEGEPLVRRAVSLAASARTAEVVLVVGHRAGEVVAAVADLAPRVVTNPRYRDGQATSVRAGLAEARGAAALVLPVDQPALDVSVLNTLIGAWEADESAFVVPEAAGRRRAPVVVPRSCFAAAQRLRGDAGMRQLFDELATAIHVVPFAEESPFLDVDTPEDWLRLEADRK